MSRIVNPKVDYASSSFSSGAPLGPSLRLLFPPNKVCILLLSLGFSPLFLFSSPPLLLAILNTGSKVEFDAVVQLEEDSAEFSLMSLGPRSLQGFPTADSTCGINTHLVPTVVPKIVWTCCGTICCCSTPF